MKKGLVNTCILCWLALVVPVAADTRPKRLGDVSDGSRALPVHVINLLDEEGERIKPDDEPLLPFSTRRTCGACHSYDVIGTGWHFNAADANVAPGRPGQPWILVDAGTATQIPLSYRSWPRTFRPQQLGLSPWQFIQIFGRHMPGGGVGELDKISDNPDEVIRSFLSGKLDINCLSCHDADPAHDQTEYAGQIARQNFRWTVAATCGFASVSGSAKDMPGTYDPFMPEPPEDPKRIPPSITYRKNAFDHKNRVFLNIVREVPAERCYFCHSNKDLDETRPDKWMADEDVHLAAGLTCVDCHRHGLDHNIIRGYEGEASHNVLAAASSCKGCHLGEDSSSVPKAGRLGAPYPKHAGIPTVHFDKLACTACHSGLWPAQKTYRTRTARAHGLGTRGVNKSDDVLPHIITPVFAKQQDGKIASHKLLWPAFWGDLRDGRVAPIPLEIARRIAGTIITGQNLRSSGDWPALTENRIIEVLSALSSNKSTEGKPVYVCAGKLYRLDDKGKLVATEHNGALPYLWPIAHDVRPAAQSLGAGGCSDCHDTGKPFFFGRVTVDSPLVLRRDSVKIMTEFEGLRPVFTKLFAVSFVFRPWLKLVALCSCAVLAGVLLLYALRALAYIVKVLAQQD